MNAADAAAFAQSVEKLGIIGVLVLVCILLGYAAFHFRKELIAAHAQREKLKMMFLIVKQAADGAGVKYDLRDAGDVDALIGAAKP